MPPVAGLDHGAMALVELRRPDPTPAMAETAPTRRVLLCPPTHFDVTYEINPWMQAGRPVDTERAVRQWGDLVDTYRDLSLDVEVAAPAPDLPDMVFAANAGLVVGGRVLVSRFRHAERRAEETAYLDWFRARGFAEVARATEVMEGEGDVAPVGDVLLAGHGFRTTLAAHRELEVFFDRPVVSLRLVDPRWYHLDTALFALGDTVAYLPEAFDAASRHRLERRFPDALLATPADALVLGCNALTVGDHVVLPAGADHLERRLRERGYEPVPIDLSELRRAGGSVKCCTLELRGVPHPEREEQP